MQEKQYIAKQQSFFNKITCILASLENNQSFYSIADFFVRFTTSSERKVSLQGEKSNVAPDRSKMIAL